MTDELKLQARIIWLERLANRCRVHGYAEYAARIREQADVLNALLPESARVDPWDDACRQPVETETVREFIELARSAMKEGAHE